MQQRPFAKYLYAAAAMIGGLVLGLGATAVSLRSGYGFDHLRLGPWTAWPGVGGAAIDPYARAAVSRTGEAPLGREQGLAFTAARDSDGELLDGSCEYRITQPAPAARFWTLTLSSTSGGLIDNESGRHGFGARELLRREGNEFDIAVSREVRAGNWISPGEARSFLLVLRLYDAPLDVLARLDAASMPKIVKLGCA